MLEANHILHITGAGHFCISFIIGFLLMMLLNKNFSASLKVQLYSSFLPFLVGLYGAAPYFFHNGECNTNSLYNVFIFYSLIHNNEFMVKIFSNLNATALICSVLYVLILLRYIRLVKYTSQYGWPSHNSTD